MLGRVNMTSESKMRPPDWVSQKSNRRVGGVAEGERHGGRWGRQEEKENRSVQKWAGATEALKWSTA